VQNYNFDNLNDKEFEGLINDLIAKREDVRVDRFKPGKDKGVDGRFFAFSTGVVIIQSKHWARSSFATLARALKKDEAQKVALLKPDRYIFATSQPLSKANKTEIRGIFHPYIKTDEDVIGQENVNDLLDEFPEVERRHYKLWLSSSNVLECMLNSALTGRSEAKRDAIIEAAKTYVVTEAHDLAIRKLNEIHSVVITGEAGVGKTTLADQLAHHYVGLGFELCVIEDDLSEVEAVYKSAKKQVLYYDDFLGRNYMLAIEGRKDSRILDLMDRIEKDKSKRFILTSRTTVLNQGKMWSDLFENRKLDRREFEVQIRSLGLLDKAKILYNLIWFGDMGEEFIDQIYEESRYQDIADHKNFNPRLISFITDPHRISELKPGDYWAYIKSKMENPRDIWSDVYDRQIDDYARILINLTVLNGGSISEVDLANAFRDCALRDGISTPSNVSDHLGRTLKSAVGSTLTRKINSRFGTVSIEPFNPSISDFVLPKLIEDHHALSAFLQTLKTTRSIDNISSLFASDRISKNIYTIAIRELCAKNLNFEVGSQKPNYFWRLAYLAFADAANPGVIPAEGYVSEIDCMLVPEFCSGSSIVMACEVIASLMQDGRDKIPKGSLEFLTWAISESESPEEFEKTGVLLESFEISGLEDVKEMKDSHREAALAYWMENIGHLIDEDGVLINFLSDEEYTDAQNWAREYIDLSCNHLSLSDDEVDKIMDGIDFSQVQYDNQKAAYEGYEGAERPMPGLKAAALPSPRDGVDDLFDRS
tara:strand:+ start:1618 stop:3909 length:2292 start_codon:yes stop_codon:yes gene_type:complete